MWYIYLRLYITYFFSFIAWWFWWFGGQIVAHNSVDMIRMFVDGCFEVDIVTDLIELWSNIPRVEVLGLCDSASFSWLCTCPYKWSTNQSLGSSVHGSWPPQLPDLSAVNHSSSKFPLEDSSPTRPKKTTQLPAAKGKDGQWWGCWSPYMPHLCSFMAT